MKIRKIDILLWLGFLVVLSSCKDDSPRFDNNPKVNFEALWNIIDRNYCFFEYKNVDWDSVYQVYDKKVATLKSPDSLFTVLAEMLGELKDGHVNLYAAHDISRYWNWKENYPENFDEKIKDKYLGKNYMIAGSIQYKILSDNIGYMYYGSFSSSFGDGNLSQIISRFSNCKGMIIDVRNNGGGDLTNVDKIAGRFFDEKTLVGYISHKTGPAHNAFSPLFPKYIEPYSGIRYKKTVVVLTNRGCYSATNDFVSVMKNSKLVTVMGDRTGGGSGLPFSSELPNGWSVRFSTSPMFDAEKQHIEFGIDPDIFVSMFAIDIYSRRDTLIESARQFINNSGN